MPPPYVNPNPRLGVLLRLHGASAALAAVLAPHRLRGLRWFERHWPEDRRRRELPGWDEGCRLEWTALLARRPAHRRSGPGDRRSEIGTFRAER